MKVSIPFKRESVLQVRERTVLTKIDRKVFQFPSNGKVYCKNTPKVLLHGTKEYSFNSLQTGKCIASLESAEEFRIESGFVSIPFKRESVLQEIVSLLCLSNSINVSIPFKRESVLQAM